MSADHVDQPALCPDCLLVAHARAEALTDHVFALPCWHRRIFALARAVCGRIVSWDLFGPDLTDRQMAQKLEAVRAAAQASGTPVSTHRVC